MERQLRVLHSQNARESEIRALFGPVLELATEP
jgi:hypothetical protein